MRMPTQIAVHPKFLLRGRLAAFRPATAGVAAVEFALVLPILCILLFGLNETTLGVNIDRKLTLVSRSLADLTSRIPNMTTEAMANIFNASEAVMQPFNDTKVQMIVSSVLITKNGNNYTGKIDWTCSKNIGTKPGNVSQTEWDKSNLKKRSSGESYPVPNGFENGSSFIVAETLRRYTPTTGYMMTGSFNLGETTPWPVRNVNSITKPTSCPA